MDNVKIRKAKIKDGLFLTVEFTEELPGHSKKETALTCTVPIHDDLKHSFHKLNKHLALLCEEIEGKIKDFEKWDHEKLHAFSVIGFSIGGFDESEGCTITGVKEGKYGNVNLSSPFQKWQKSQYPFIEDFGSDIEACLYEVEQYLFHGKRAPEQQLSMFEEEPIVELAK